MKLAEELAAICNERAWLGNEAYQKREEERLSKLRASMQWYLDSFIKRARELVNTSGGRWCIVQKPVKTNAKHSNPQTTRCTNVCTPDDLLEESKLLYNEVVEMGFKVEIKYYHDRDYDEPGNYDAGYEMIARW